MFNKISLGSKANFCGVRFSLLSLTALCSVLSGGAAFAGPEGGNVVAGQATISRPDANTTNINQSTDRGIIDWATFNVAKQETVNFKQPKSTSMTLNRILGQNPSQILGAVNANGRVVLLNPNGVVFGAGGSVNVNGLITTSMQISNQDFMQGNLKFTDGEGMGAIINRGNITAAEGGYVALMGDAVLNEGVIIADFGSIDLAAGKAATLDFGGDGMLRFTLDEAATENMVGFDDAVMNRGDLIANGGRIALTASAARDVFGSLVNNEGVIQAQRIDNTGGVIRLVADGGITQHTGVIDASGDANSSGGSVQILGDRVGVYDGAVVDASGGTGGGEILVGGSFQGKDEGIKSSEFTLVAGESSLNADARDSGDGGTVIVWSDKETIFHDSGLSVRGGAESGDGGFAEISGKEVLTLEESDIDLAAENGQAGSLLLDPNNLYIVSAGVVNESLATELADGSLLYSEGSTGGTEDGSVLASDITGLAGAVTLQASEDVFIGATISDTNITALTIEAGYGGTAGLTNAAGDIIFEAAGVCGGATCTDGFISLTGNTSVTLNAGGSITSNHSGTNIDTDGTIVLSAGEAGGGAGAIGAIGSPIQLAADNTVTATAEDGIFLTSPGSMTVNGLDAGTGDIDLKFGTTAASTLTLTGDIFSGTSASNTVTGFVGAGDDVLDLSNSAAGTGNVLVSNVGTGSLAGAGGFAFSEIETIIGDSTNTRKIRSATGADDIFTVTGSEAGTMTTGGVEFIKYEKMINIFGLVGDDTVISGLAGPATFNITSDGIVTVSGTKFSTVEVVEGSAGSSDTFIYRNAGDMGLVKGGGGQTDIITIDNSTSATAVVLTDTLSGSGTVTGLTGTFEGIERIEGNGTDQSLTGTANDDVFDITATDSGTVKRLVAAGPELTYTGFVNLDGGAGANTINVLSGTTGDLNINNTFQTVTLNSSGLDSLTVQGASTVSIGTELATSGAISITTDELTFGGIGAASVIRAGTDLTLTGFTAPGIANMAWDGQIQLTGGTTVIDIEGGTTGGSSSDFNLLLLNSFDDDPVNINFTAAGTADYGSDSNRVAIDLGSNSNTVGVITNNGAGTVYISETSSLLEGGATQLFTLVEAPGLINATSSFAPTPPIPPAENPVLQQLFKLAQRTADKAPDAVDYAAFDPDNKLYVIEDEGVCLPADQRDADGSDDCQAALNEQQQRDRQFADMLLASWLEGAQTADHSYRRMQ
jgi:filamentous hemagglutinin family protein